MINFLLITSIITSCHSLILAVYFFTRKRTQYQENIIFGAILTLFSLLVISNMLSVTALLIGYGKILFVSRHLSLIITPLVYIYIHVILIGKAYSYKEYLKHFAFFLITTPVLIAILWPIDEFNAYFSKWRFVSGFLILPQNIYYLIRTYRLIRREKENKKLVNKIKWSQTLLFGFLFIWMVQFCSFILIDIYRDFYICPYTVSMYFVGAFVMAYIIIFFLIEGTKIVSHKSKYKTSALEENGTRDLFKKVQHLFETDKPYLDNEFTLSKLAEDMGHPVKHISQAINAMTHGNFTDFVTNYRLEEGKRLLLDTDGDQLSVAEIYFRIGYNSKSTFYTAFKKKYKQTPTEFRKSKIDKN